MTDTKKLRVTARIRLTIEISSEIAWAPSATAEQVFEQAGTDAVTGLRNKLKAQYASLEIIGEPQVLATCFNESLPQT